MDDELETEGVIGFEGYIRTGGHEAGFGIDQVMVENQIDVAARLRDPVEATVEAEVIGNVVELDQVGPGQGIGEDNIRLEGHEPGNEFALYEFDVVEVVGSAEVQVFAGPP